MKLENRLAFLQQMENLAAEGKSEVDRRESELHRIYLSDQVAGPYGGATFEEDDDEIGCFNFEITLGPANSKRLVEFLQSLPSEPTYDDDLGKCPKCDGGLTGAYHEKRGRYAHCRGDIDPDCDYSRDLREDEAGKSAWSEP